MKFREIEAIILKDGWRYKSSKGSHCQYTHTEKKGKVTIPKHNGDLDQQTVKSILQQAGL